jgi:hypothetical protein
MINTRAKVRNIFKTVKLSMVLNGCNYLAQHQEI